MFVNGVASIAGGEGKPLVLQHPLATYTCVQKLGNDPVVMQSEQRRQCRGWSPESSTLAEPGLQHSKLGIRYLQVASFRSIP